MRIKDTCITRKPYKSERKSIKKNTYFSARAEAAEKEKAERSREMNKLFDFFMDVTADGTDIPRRLIDIRTSSPKYKGEKVQERLLKF